MKQFVLSVQTASNMIEHHKGLENQVNIQLVLFNVPRILSFPIANVCQITNRFIHPLIPRYSSHTDIYGRNRRSVFIILLFMSHINDLM